MSSKTGRPRTTAYPWISSRPKFRGFLEGILEAQIPKKIDKGYLKHLKLDNPAEYTQVIRVLTDIGLIDEKGVPTELYSKYRKSEGPERTRLLRGQIEKGYYRLFEVKRNAWMREQSVLVDFFEKEHDPGSVDHKTLKYMANMFQELCGQCDWYDENSKEIVELLQEVTRLGREITFKQENQLRQAIACYETEAYRAAIVLAWTAVSDYMHEYLAKDLNHLASLGSVDTYNGSVNFSKATSIDVLHEHFTDAQVIVGIVKTFKEKTGEYIGDVLGELKAHRISRNKCAHQYYDDPDSHGAYSYIMKCLKIIGKLHDRKEKQFS